MFTIDNNGNITVAPEILLIPEFRALWNKDKTKNKSSAMMDFTYIYYTTDFKSPYVKSYAGEDLVNKVKSDFTSEDWKESKFVKDAINKYTDLQKTKTLKLFEAADSALSQIYTYLKNFKIDEVDDEKRDTVVNNVLKNIEKVPDIGLKLDSARRSVERELEAGGRQKGTGNIKSRELPRSRRK